MLALAKTTEYFQILIAVGIAIITVRSIYIAHQMSTSSDEGVSISSILAKVSNHMKAAIIMVIAEGLIQWFKDYLILHKG